MTVHAEAPEDNEFKALATGSSLQKLAITGSVVAAWAAFAWLALGAKSIARPVQVNYRDALWMVPFVLTAIVFTFLHAVQRLQTDHSETASGLFFDDRICAWFSREHRASDQSAIIGELCFSLGSNLVDAWFGRVRYCNLDG